MFAEAGYLPCPAAEDLRLEEIMHALSDPMRLRIVRELARDNAPRACGAFHLPVAKSTCTHHFRVLRDAGLITQREEGTQRLNQLRVDDLEARFPGLLALVARTTG